MADDRSRSGIGRTLVAVAVLTRAFAAAADHAPATPADAGERLFAGRTRFVNGGPPCASCHDIAGLPFPHGGSVGPDLTRTYGKYGEGPLDTVLSTLYFPTMQALFAERPLTSPERRDLIGFFQRAGTLGAQSSPSSTLRLAASALMGAFILLAVAWATWRRRLRGVRRPMVAESKGRPA